MKIEQNINSVIVLGSGINALGVVRSFANKKIPVFVIDYQKDVAAYSKYCRFELCNMPNDEKNFITYLKKYLDNFQLPPVIFPTSDLYLFILLKNTKELKEKALIPISDWEIVSKLLEKEYLYDLADKISVPHPKTKITNSINDIDSSIKDIQFPIIIKPSITYGFASEMGDKAFILYNTIELDILKKKLANTSFKNKTLIIQEYIPGNVDSLYTITSYANKESEIIGYSIGHKIRQSPPITGTIISGKVEHIEEVFKAAKKFIKFSNFYGISNIEFKKDIRDNSYKLIEINPRTGLWNYSVLSCGINLPLMAYKDILGEKIQPEYNKEIKLIWLDTILDLYCSIWGFKKRGYKNASLNLKEWYKSIKGKKIDATFNIKDIKPFLAEIYIKTLGYKKQ